MSMYIDVYARTWLKYQYVRYQSYNTDELQERRNGHAEE